MSSDYLNYELSKELHDLGVVFEKKMYYIDASFSTAFPDEYLDKSKLVVTPSTAQLIDEIAKRTWFDLTLDEDAVEFDIQVLHGNIESDPCATTALGKSLVALIKKRQVND